jgi:glucokinase
MILAGDVGGTKVFLGIFTRHGEKLTLAKERVFASRDYPDLGEVIDVFLKERKVSVRAACFGVPGPVIEGRCETTNLPWVVDAAQIARRFGIAQVFLLNDLEATGYGTLELEEREFHLFDPALKPARGNRAVIAAGTGLGEAILFWNGSGYQASASEGGHTDFAPRNPLEIELLRYLLARYPRVSYERVLSGPGLFNIYQFLKETGRGEEPPWLAERLDREDPGSAISETGLSGKADLCVKALDLFVSIYGAEAGNLALKAMAIGGVDVAGGIAPKILKKMTDGTFMRAFVEKGRSAPLMRRIPVRIVLNERTGLLGAARYASIKGATPP